MCIDVNYIDTNSTITGFVINRNVAIFIFGGKHTLIYFFKALWRPDFICKFLASQTYDFNQIFSVGRENIVLQAHIIS